MIKKILTFAIASIVFWSCNSNTRQAEDSDSAALSDSLAAMDSVSVPKDADTTKVDKTETTGKKITDEHNSQNSLDWTGTYTGVLPCADCEGIETKITLNDDMQYVIQTKYLGKSDSKIFEEKGVFSWDRDGSTLTFEAPGVQSKKYFVGENTLTQLDGKGEKIKGALANKYILKK